MPQIKHIRINQLNTGGIYGRPNPDSRRAILISIFRAHENLGPLMYSIFYGFLYVVSLLPMRVLYMISDVIYGIVYYLIGYRRKVVMDNLRQAFPEKAEAELVVIAKQFYHNFIDSFL